MYVLAYYCYLYINRTFFFETIAENLLFNKQQVDNLAKLYFYELQQ